MNHQFRHRRKKGFVLVLVVVMILITSLVLARLSSVSLREAQSAAQNERHMRDRWAIATLRGCVLSRAERLLRDQAWAGESDSQNSDLTSGISLGGSYYQLRLADESRKFNVRKLLERERPLQVVRQEINRLQSGSVRLPISSRIASSRSSVSTWHECFQRMDQTSSGYAKLVKDATHKMTLWGDGRLNIYKADDDTVDSLWRALTGVSAPRDTHRLRRIVPSIPIREIIGESASQGETTPVDVTEWLTSTSDTYSLWISQRRRRLAQHFLFVQRTGGSQDNFEQLGYVW